MVKYWSCLKLMFLTEVKQVMFCLLISAPVLGTNILFHGLFSTMFYSVSLITREVQMKTTPVRMTVRKKDNTCWQGDEERGTLVYCQWKCKVAELLWKMSFPYFCAFHWWHHCLKWSSSLVLRQCLLDPSARRQWCDVEKICILDEAWVLVSMNHLLAVSSMLMNQQYMVFAIEYLFFSGRNTLIFF